MKCPKCNNAVLQKKEFSSPHACSECEGLWLESESLNELPEMPESSLDKGDVNNNDAKTGLCPNGHGILIRARIDDQDQPFYLEKCSTCNGIWFDKGEWKKVADNHLQENLLQIWSYSWQKEQRKIKKEIEIKELYEEKLGSELYNNITDLAKTLNSHPEKHRALILLREELNKKTQ